MGYEMNPELQRNLRLELTPHRMFAMPLVLGLFFLFLAVVSSDDWPDSLASTASWFIGAIVLLWGGRQATESVIEEISQRTWDWQRMSTLSPWDMTWGKLFGATSYSWYGAILCALVLIFTLPAAESPSNALVILSALFGYGLLMQALGLTLALHIARRYRAISSRETTGAYFLMLLMTSGVLPAILINSLESSVPDLVWHGLPLPRTEFNLLSLWIFVGWAWLGAYHAMRRELQFKNPPWAWLAFVVFCMVYLAGFDIAAEHEKELAVPFTWLIAFGTGLFWTYLLLLSEAKDLTQARHLALAWQRGQWADLLDQTPRWLLTLLLTSAIALVALVVAPHVPIDSGYSALPIIMLSMTLFALRDVGIVLLLNWPAKLNTTPNANRRADVAAMVYFLVLYLVVPGILANSEFPALAALFWPVAHEQNAWAILLPPLLEVGLVFSLLANRLRGLWTKLQ